jgi:hypothetical protein
VRGGDAEEGPECGMSGAPAVEAEDEFIEVGLEVLAAQPVIDAQGPDLEVGEDPVNPREHDVGGHLADDVGIVGDPGGAGIPGPAVGFGGGAGGEIGGKKGVEAGGRVIGDLAEADTAGARPAVLDLDGADDEHFAPMAAPAAARDRIVSAAARDFGFINLDEAGQRAAARGEHAAAQLGADQPRRLVGAESELTLQLQSRDAIGVGGHQISGPEPGCQRQLGVVHDGAGSDRGLPTAAGALIGPGLGFQPPGFATLAAWAHKPVRPARRGKILSAGGLIAEALLELDQGARKVGHRATGSGCVRDLFYHEIRPGYNILCSRTQRDKALARNMVNSRSRIGVKSM